MRKKLGELTGQRKRFRGTFGRYGIRPALALPPVRTLVLTDLQDESGIVVADHLWFRVTGGFESLGELTEGAVLEFDARVTEYQRHQYRGRPENRKSTGKSVRDFKLSYPTRIEVKG